jgi:hypothetical protein
MLQWSRWPLALSLVLHAAVIGIGWLRWPTGDRPLRTDFWAGDTFEAPDLVEEATASVDDGWSMSGAAASEPAGPTVSAAEEQDHAVLSPSPRRLATRKSLAPPGAPTPAASSKDPGQESGGFGADGAAAGLRDLVRSFVRAIPAAASSDPEWASMPVGPAGSTELTLILDADAKPRTGEPLDPRLPPPLRRMILKTLLVLSGGRFAISGDAPSMQKLRIAASVTQLAPPAGAQAQAGGAFGLGFEPPDDRRVSRAFFTLASGRHIEVTVRPSR